MRLSRSRGGKYAARPPARALRRARLGGKPGRHLGPPAWQPIPLSRRLLRVATWTLLLPVSVGAAAPQMPTPAQPPGAHPVLARTSLLEGGAARTEPVASVTLVAANEWAVSSTPQEMAARGVPRPALHAYRAAEVTLRVADPGCRLSWSLLAGIGGVESDHGRATAPALGPMQFVPSAWEIVGVDGDADAKRDPHDIDDAALSAAAYLCAGGGDLNTSGGVRDALSSYNRSQRYGALVVDVARAYRRIVGLPPLTGAAQTPAGPGVAVGVGNPGGGMLIGASDNVADDADAGGNGDRADGQNAGRPSAGRHDGDDEPVARRGRHDRHQGPGPRPAQSDRSGDRPQPDRSRRPRRDGGDRTAPRKRAPTKDSDRPADQQPKKQGGGGGGAGNGTGGSGQDEPDAQPVLKEFTGKVTPCEDGVNFCLRGRVLVGPHPYGDWVDQTITVRAVVEGQTLLVDEII